MNEAPAQPSHDFQPPDPGASDRLSRLESLLVVLIQLTECSNELNVPELLSKAMSTLGRSRLCGVYLTGSGWIGVAPPCEKRTVRTSLEAQFIVLDEAGDRVEIPGTAWACAVPLRSLDDHLGYLVVGADTEPSPDEQTLLGVLAKQTGIVLANARSGRLRSQARKLRSANAALSDMVGTLERSALAHERLDQVARAGGDPADVAQVVHNFTDLPVAVEDTRGNLRAWAGPGPPEPSTEHRTGRRDRLLDTARRERRPIRADGRLVTVAERHDQVLGVLALVDPDDRAGPREEDVLAHGATVLTIELGRQRDVAETELRLGRDLVSELVAGTEDSGAFARADALGYDLARPHHVVVIESPEGADAPSFFHAVRRAARDTEVGTLLAERDGAVVLLAVPSLGTARQSPWTRLQDAISREPGGGPCRIGVGEPTERPADFPRSYRQARLALSLHAVTGGPDRAITFEGLGVYRLFDASQLEAVEQFVRAWLGSLIDYDTDHRSRLVATLTTYLEHGGRYDATAKAMAVHRNTIKYRLRRIREIAGRDLTDPDTHFNLQLATRAWQTLIALRNV